MRDARLAQRAGVSFLGVDESLIQPLFIAIGHIKITYLGLDDSIMRNLSFEMAYFSEIN